MSTPEPIDPRDLRTCRKCGFVFSRVHGSCPQCGATRDHRRKQRRSQRLQDRVEYAWHRVQERLRRYKWYILYIGGGVVIAAIIQPTAMFLAEFSRPPDWRERRWEAGWSLGHFFEPFVAAGETLWRWITNGVVSAVTWTGETLTWLLMARPSTVFAVVVGGGIGAYLAWRRTHRRRRRRHRHQTPGHAATGSSAAQSVPSRPSPTGMADWTTTIRGPADGADTRSADDRAPDGAPGTDRPGPPSA